MSRRLVHAAVLVALLGAAGCNRRPSGNPDPLSNTYAPALEVSLPQFTRTTSGLYYRDVQPGAGAAAAAGRTVSVHYTGWLPSGEQFDSSRDRGEPIEFALGQGAVIQGWDEGVAGMQVGGRRKLVIPAPLGYGASGGGPIPPNSVLVFDVELMAVK
jgi:FKBP-type peptidyl-prolyl cis-trans isomerase FkpA